MANLILSVPHQLGTKVALERIRKLISTIKQDHADEISDVWEQWHGNQGEFRFLTKGFKIQGTITVFPDHVQLNGTLPWAANFFKGKIEEVVREEAEKLLA